MEEEIVIILDPKKVQVKLGSRKFTVKSADDISQELAASYAQMGIYALQNQAHAAAFAVGSQATTPTSA